MKSRNYLVVFLMIFISILLSSKIYGLSKTEAYQTKKEDAAKDDSLKFKNSHLNIDENTYLVMKDSVYGQCPCGHPTVTPDVECTVPGCPYSKRDD